MLEQTTFPNYFPNELRKPESEEVSDAKINALVGAMTAEEKFLLFAGAVNPDDGGQIANGGFMPGIPRLGIPEIRMYDGPAGITSIRETTGLPVPVLLSSTWDEELAYDFGSVAASENAAVSGNCQLGTQVDLIRTPHFSRNKDMKGEDYVLSSRLAVAETKGVQDQGVIACLKHLAAANTTSFSERVNEVVDEQTLHQMYLRPFEEAIEEADPGAVMDTYSSVNGDYATNSSYLNTDVLRGMWNFKGAVMSDWGANHNMTLGKGMDIEMPRAAFNSPMRILRGIQDGSLTWEDVNNGVRHVLGMYASAGLLGLVELGEDGRPKEEFGRTRRIQMIWSYEEEKQKGLLERNADIARTIAEKGIILAKNENSALPLKNKKTALIGMGACSAFCGTGQERSFGTLSRMISPAKQYEKKRGEVPLSAKAFDIIGNKVDAGCLFQDAEGKQGGVIRTFGVTKEEYALAPARFMPGGGGLEFNGVSGELDEYGELVENLLGANLGKFVVPGECNNTPAGTFCCIDRDIDFHCDSKDYQNHENGTAFSYGERYTWKGYIKAPETGIYKIKLHFIGGEAAFIVRMGDEWVEIAHPTMREGAHWPWDCVIPTEEGMGINTKLLALEEGKLYPFYLFAAAGDPNKNMQVRMAWITPSQQKKDYEDALKAAGEAEQIVFFFNENEDECGFFVGDKTSLKYPAEQLKLFEDIQKIAKEGNKPLITVCQGAGGLETAGWKDASDAVVLSYYPGQEGSGALMDILLGEVNPTGKLTLTWPADEKDTPLSDTKAHAVMRNNGIREGNIKNIYFSEGILTGYRWYDEKEIDPGFCFGHGLSYTTYAYRDLLIEKKGGTYTVSFTVENTGDRTGDEIAQVYIGKGEVPAGVQIAKKQLVAFTRMKNLEAGEARRVSLEIPWRELCCWNPAMPLQTRENGTKDKYVPVYGTRKIFVGASERDIRLEGELTVELPE